MNNTTGLFCDCGTELLLYNPRAREYVCPNPECRYERWHFMRSDQGQEVLLPIWHTYQSPPREADVALALSLLQGGKPHENNID